MDWESILSIGLPIVLYHLVMAYVLGTSNKVVQPDASGKIRLRLHKVYYWIGCFSIAFGAIPTTLFLVDGDFTGEWWVLLVFLGFGALGWICIMWYNNHQVCFDEDKMEVTNWRGEKRIMYWHQIKKAKFQSVQSYIVFDDTINTVKVNTYLMGIAAFLAKMEQKTKWTAKKLKIPFVE